MKKIFRRIVILAFVFVAAVAAVFFLTRKTEEETVYTTMGGATLPLVSMEFEGSPVNTLRGYVEEMHIPSMRDTITPVPGNRKLPFTIHTYGNEIQSVEYDVRSLDGENLIETKVCETLSPAGETVRGELTFQDLLAKGTEYVLVLKVRTGSRENIHYYTRLRYYDDTHIGEQIAFAKNFRELAFTKNITEDLTVQLESNNETDNSTLGYADIKSSYNHVAWGGLKPEISGEISMDIKEMNEMVGSLQFLYTVTAAGEAGGQETYQVKEFFCVRFVEGKLWLIAYERTMDQVFEASEETVRGETIELGILSPKNTELEIRKAGDYTVFAVDGELWSYQKTGHEMTRLFSFKEDSDGEARSLYDQHEFRIVNAEENGDVSFVVCGYMNRGIHEGECGLSFYQYSREENTVSEIFYIPSDRPYQVLKEELRRLFYVGKNQLLYLMFENGIYAIDFSGEECVELVSGLKEHTFATSSEFGAAAWQEEEDIYGGKTIQVYDMDKGESFAIQADAGEVIRPLGFIDGDFIYGKTKEEDIKRKMTVEYPMYALEIVGRDGKAQTTYTREGMYIRGIEVEDGKIQIERQRRDSDGAWVEAESDALIQNQVTEEEESALVRDFSELKKTTYAVKTGDSGAEDKRLSVRKPRTLAGREIRVLEVGRMPSEVRERPKQYYAYASGRLEGICGSPAEAIWLVYDQMGVVVGNDQNYVWTRANRRTEALAEPVEGQKAASEDGRLSACLSMMLREAESPVDAATELAAGKSAYEILDSLPSGKAVDLHGCILNQMLYYVNRGCPVMAMTKGSQAELILGYDIYKNLIIYNPLTGEKELMPEEEAEKYYGAYGYPFISWVP
ncbi:MAG: hypothetical protein HFI63_02865 [Lachnospiraceae bacterium]|nr:hypothetical protein [Lachnospiraceae bacterium]